MNQTWKFQIDNKNIMNMGIKDYKAPRAEVIEVNIEAMLCQSGGIDGMIIDEEDGGESFS